MADGIWLGILEGSPVGAADGTVDGAVDGAAEGTVDGSDEGTDDGLLDGVADGALEGVRDGAKDGLPDGCSCTFTSSTKFVVPLALVDEIINTITEVVALFKSPLIIPVLASNARPMSLVAASPLASGTSKSVYE
jgi:hypothetical protein